MCRWLLQVAEARDLQKQTSQAQRELHAECVKELARLEKQVGGVGPGLFVFCIISGQCTRPSLVAVICLQAVALRLHLVACAAGLCAAQLLQGVPGRQ